MLTLRMLLCSVDGTQIDLTMRSWGQIKVDDEPWNLPGKVESAEVELKLKYKVHPRVKKWASLICFAPGLKWIEEESKPEGGKKLGEALKNIPELQKKLKEKSSMQGALYTGRDFTEMEWKRFKTGEKLTKDHFIKAGAKYYRPAVLGYASAYIIADLMGEQEVEWLEKACWRQST